MLDGLGQKHSQKHHKGLPVYPRQINRSLASDILKMLTRQAFSGANTTVKRQAARTVRTQAASADSIPRTNFKGDESFQFAPILNVSLQLCQSNWSNCS